MAAASRTWPQGHLPPPGGEGETPLLAIGAPPTLLAGLRAAGYGVATHELDDRPLAALGRELFTPPETAWPFADGTFEAVVILDRLAFVVDEAAAIAEAARVLRPGGTLLLRLPGAGPLAWLDAYNLFRYLRDVTGRGPRVTETRGIGWRRHYRRRDVTDLLARQFTPPRITGHGLGLAELARLILMLLFRWLVHWEGVYQWANRVVPRIHAAEFRLRLGPLGADLLVTSRKNGPPGAETYAFSSACSKSAIRSPTVSRPTERRT